MKLKNLLLILLMNFIAINFISAQIIDSNAYMQSAYLEVGINQGGVYVSDTPAPDGYHSQMLLWSYYEIDSSTIDTVVYIYDYEVYDYDTTCFCWVVIDTITDTLIYETYEYLVWYDTLPSPLGIIYDSDMDGWDTGDPTEFWGDVTLPGSPEEGFGIEIGGQSYYNASQYLYPFNIPGYFSGWDDSGDTTRTIWEGDIADHNLHVKQETLLPDNKLYFYTRVTLTNTGTDDAGEVYYMRNFDPDQEQPWSYDFVTNNEVIYNNPTDTQCLVSAEGNTMGGNFAMYGTRAENGKVSYGAFFTSDANPVSDAWNAVSPFSGSGEFVGDIALQVSFKIDELAAGESETFTFVYIFSNDEAIINEALAGTKMIPEVVECLAASDFNASDISLNSANITWAPGSAGLEYLVEWRKVGTPEWNSATTGDLHFVITGLESCTYYDYRVTTLCGTAIISDAYVFRTECASSIEEVSTMATNIYPNPAQDNFNIDVNLAAAANATIIITDAIGNVVYEKTIAINKLHTENIQLKNMASGVYAVKVISGDETSVTNVIIE